MPRILLLLPTSTYRAPDFLRAAAHLGVEIVVGSEQEQALAADMGDRAVVVPLSDATAAAAVIVALDARSPIDAVVAVDDQGVLVAATAGERLGFPHNPPAAVAATRDKASMRAALAAAEVPQPAFAMATDPETLPELGYPCVVKPVDRSASQGVIRADDAEEARAAADAGPCDHERTTPRRGVRPRRGGRGGGHPLRRRPGSAGGVRQARPAGRPVLRGDDLRHAVTPASRDAGAVADLTGRACAAMGLVEGPVHAELRIDGDRMWVIEVAARSIGGLCARALRFGAGIALEELVLRHALRLPLDGLVREQEASGVMMLPTPRAGVLREVRGQEAARAVPGVTGLEITVPRGRRVLPLPEGDRYLGFLFARGETPAAVESSLRAAHAALTVEIAPDPAP